VQGPRQPRRHRVFRQRETEEQHPLKGAVPPEQAKAIPPFQEAARDLAAVDHSVAMLVALEFPAQYPADSLADSLGEDRPQRA